MKNIIILAREYPTPGGRITFVKELMENLSKKEFNFKIISWEEGNDILTVRKRSKNTIIDLIKYYIESIKILAKLKKQIKIDLILGTGLSSLGGMLFAKTNKIPSIYNLSAARGSEKIKKKTTKKKIKKEKKPNFIKNIKVMWSIGIRTLSEFFSAYLAKKLTVPSESCRKNILKRMRFLNGKKIITINEGIKINPKRYEKEKILEKINLSKTNTIIAISRIESENLLKELLEKIDKSIKLIIIEPKEIKLRKENKLEKLNINFKEILSILDLLVCVPFIDAHSYTVLEGLENNIPVIVSDTGWFSHEFDEFRNIMVEPEIKDINNKIEEFMENKQKIVEESNKARKKLLMKYDLNKCINEYSSLFDKLIR